MLASLQVVKVDKVVNLSSYKVRKFISGQANELLKLSSCQVTKFATLQVVKLTNC